MNTEAIPKLSKSARRKRNRLLKFQQLSINPDFKTEKMKADENRIFKKIKKGGQMANRNEIKQNITSLNKEQNTPKTSDETKAEQLEIEIRTINEKMNLIKKVLDQNLKELCPATSKENAKAQLTAEIKVIAEEKQKTSNMTKQPIDIPKSNDKADNIFSKATSNENTTTQLKAEIKTIVAEKQKTLNMMKQPIVIPMSNDKADTISSKATSNEYTTTQLTPEIKAIVEEKQKTLNMTKQPIIMPRSNDKADTIFLKDGNRILLMDHTVKPKLTEVKPTQQVISLGGKPIKVLDQTLHKKPKPNETIPKTPVVPKTTTQMSTAGNLINVLDQTIHKRSNVEETATVSNPAAAAKTPYYQLPIDNKRIEVFNQSIHTKQKEITMPPKFPAGVPKSFLAQQTNFLGAIQPQVYMPNMPSQNLQMQPMWQMPANSGFPSPNPTYPVPNLTYPTPNQMYPYASQPTTSMQTTVTPTPMNYEASNPMFILNPIGSVQEQFSPTSTEPVNISQVETNTQEDSDSQDSQSNQKRPSAFKRLGPLTISQPKKAKLTINLMFNKREVVEGEKKETYVPVHLREDILSSSDEIVMKFLNSWPWKKKWIVRKSVAARKSKSVMLLEQEQMEEFYNRENVFLQISVTGYPPTWKKEEILDMILDGLKGKSFIPCFIECTEEECKFLVIRCRAALAMIQKLGYTIRKDDMELHLTISVLDISLKVIDFLPKMVLRKKLAIGYDGEMSLDLKEFTLKSDISHFIYFPLKRETNQVDLVQLQSTIAWDYITELNLSHNHLTTLEGFDLLLNTPKLKHLDISFNKFERIAALLSCRNLGLHTIKLEGNPLCHDYRDPSLYVQVIRMLFPTLIKIDGVPIHFKGQMPHYEKYYCPEPAKAIVDIFLEIYFPLMEANPEERDPLENVYHQNAVLTITHRPQLRHGTLFKHYRNIFLRSRVMEDFEKDSIRGPAAIIKHIKRWPSLEHDSSTFTVDVLSHTESATIVKIGGIMKLNSETLAEDEQLVAFSRCLVLGTENGVEYKIYNELLHWDVPVAENVSNAFQVTRVRQKHLSLDLERTPDANLKENLVKIFMKLTDLESESSERCLEIKKWNLKSALEYFMKLLKLDDLASLKSK